MNPNDSAVSTLVDARRDDTTVAAQRPIAVVVRDLVKRYPKRPTNAVDGVSFAVGQGEVFGLLGPNGAGKTTTVGVLTTRVRPTGGYAEVAGIDVARDPVGAKRRLAVVPQRSNLDRALSARQILLFHAAYFGVPAEERTRRANELLEQFGLTERADDKVDFFSGGQSQRIMIARALMHEPEVLFLDEPTTGLDPQARLFVWDRIRDLKSRGVTMILTTHDMEEAASLCDRVAIMDRGKLLASDTPDALKETVPGRNSLEVGILLDGGDRDALQAALAALPGVERIEPVTKAAAGPPVGMNPFAAFAGGVAAAGGPPPQAAAAAPAGTPYHLRLYASVDAPSLVAPMARLITDHDGELVDLSIGKPSLEDVFIHLTGRALR
ncbi:MAG: ABC transporter ATP-binding protein [Candidatus Dormibacter sp.]